MKIADSENAVLVAIIENFQIQARDDGSQDYVIEAFPLGVLRDQKFERGGDALAIPPKTVQPATIRLNYGSSATNHLARNASRWSTCSKGSASGQMPDFSDAFPASLSGSTAAATALGSRMSCAACGALVGEAQRASPPYVAGEARPACA